MRRTPAAILLISVLMITACAPKQPSFEVKIDPALKTLVPADTVFMAGARVETLLKMPLFQEYVANLQVPPTTEFARRTGIDPRKDLWELLFISNGHGGLLLGRGKFADPEQLKTDGGARRSVYKGLSLIGDDAGAILFISPTTAALGSVPALHSLVDQSQKASGPPAPLAALLKEIPASAQLWTAYIGGPVKLPFEQNSNLANVNRLLMDAQSGTAYFDLSTGLKGTIEITFSSGPAAQQARDTVQALVGFGRLSVPSGREDLLAVYDHIQVTQDQQRVKAQIDLTQELADKFLKTVR
jgi:hypothetical protein